MPDVLRSLDPLGEGAVGVETFLEYVGLRRKQIHDEEEEDGDEEDREREAAEIRWVYGLFTKGGPGPISAAHLRRVARDIRAEVDDQSLRDMIVLANGNLSGGWKRGVAYNEFEEFVRSYKIVDGS
jgi:Ca2+-binding EF-hand superfamily protein